MDTVTGRVFLDTNVLIYSISNLAEDEAKRGIAIDLLTRRDCALSVQVLQEFVHQATRTSRHGAITTGTAWAMVAAWRRFPVVESTLALLSAAEQVQRQTSYSIWDCLIVAAAQAQGCETLYTEDMQHGRIIDRLRIVNPFR